MSTLFVRNNHDSPRCRALIKSGPRRGEMCGRPCLGTEHYCRRYHYRMYGEDFKEEKRERRNEIKTDFIREWESVQTNIRTNTFAIIPDRSVIRDPEIERVEIRPVIRIPEVEWVENRPIIRPTIAELPNNLYQNAVNPPEKTPLQILTELTGIRLQKPSQSKFRSLFCCLWGGNSTETVEDACTICTCDPAKDEIWIRTPCKHTFHVECIKEWIDQFQFRDKGCPLCRAPIENRIKEGFRIE